MSFRYAALVSYMGGRFCGWQSQGKASGSAPSVQSVIEEALRTIAKQKVMAIASGRTDAGVHAIGQTLHFDLSKEWKPEQLARAINTYLPWDVRVLASRGVDSEFHAQRSAVRKQYSYYFFQAPTPLPHLNPFSWWVPRKLDLHAMREALASLRGEHDFKSFQAAGSPVKGTVRTIFEAEVDYEPLVFPRAPGALLPVDWGWVRLRLVGSGFLKQMVRGIAGTLREIGEGKRPVRAFERILKSRSRAEIGQTAPGRGLWLERVWYDPDPFQDCFD